MHSREDSPAGNFTPEVVPLKPRNGRPQRAHSPDTVELPGPAPFSQATQLTILRLPQSVYISMIKGAVGISNGFRPTPPPGSGRMEP